MLSLFIFHIFLNSVEQCIIMDIPSDYEFMASNFLEPSEIKEESGHNDEEISSKHYKCTDCDSSFSKKQELKFHIASVHEGQTLYECSECDMR